MKKLWFVHALSVFLRPTLASESWTSKLTCFSETSFGSFWTSGFLFSFAKHERIRHRALGHRSVSKVQRSASLQIESSGRNHRLPHRKPAQPLIWGHFPSFQEKAKIAG